MDIRANEEFRYHNLKQLNRNRYYYDYATQGIVNK